MKPNYKPIILVILTIFCLSLFAPVYGASTEGSKKEISVTDLTGRNVTLQVPVQKIVLEDARDIHEIAAIAGDSFLDNIVGWTSDLDKLDHDTYMKIKENHPDIDNIPIIGSYYDSTFSAEKVISLKPDVIIIPVWDQESSAKDVAKLEEAGVKVVYTDFWKKPLENPSKSVRLLGQLLDKEDRAEEIADYYDEKVGEIQSKIEEANAEKPSVYIEGGWSGPTEYGGTYGNVGWGAVVKAAGGKNIAETQVDSYAPIKPEYLISQNPDVIVISGANWTDVPGSLQLGYYSDETKAKEQLKSYTARNGWNTLKAVQNNDVYGLFHGYCFRIYNYAALEALAKWFHPDLFSSFDPVQDVKDFHQKYMPFDYSGTWFVSLKE